MPPDWFMLNKFFLKFGGQKGFTLVEVMVALSISAVGIIGAYELVNQSLSMSNSAARRFGAIYLANEGLEIARNIRDANYLELYYDGSGSWNDGLTGCASGCGADYLSGALDASPSTYNMPLKSSGGFFSYSSGAATAYKRKITVEDRGDYLEVSVQVKWGEDNWGGKDSVTARENLYNWWQ